MPGIEYVCTARHDGGDRGHDGPTVTVYESRWACCPTGGSDGHAWKRIPPTTVDDMRASARPREQMRT
ncbi:MAG TPA: hypothetical protein VFV20_01515 [Candidatus Limnocylindria bacterium]|nr:hypothetical protein [Candidatus Limnocylindria bacterium]